MRGGQGGGVERGGMGRWGSAETSEERYCLIFLDEAGRLGRHLRCMNAGSS